MNADRSDRKESTPPLVSHRQLLKGGEVELTLPQQLQTESQVAVVESCQAHLKFH